MVQQQYLWCSLATLYFLSLAIRWGDIEGSSIFICAEEKKLLVVTVLSVVVLTWQKVVRSMVLYMTT